MSHALAQELLPLIPSQLRPLLGRLVLPTPHRYASATFGPHLSPIRGQSVEFFEHRNYSQGDDPRRIDWRASAKGDRTMVRFGEREQTSAVYIFLDNHSGMAYGEQDPPQRWAWARGVAALLAHSALLQGDPVALIMRPQDLAPPSHRRQHIAQMCTKLREHPNAKTSQIKPSLQAWARQEHPAGRLFLISDWLDLSNADHDHDHCARALFKILQTLVHRGHLAWGLELLHRDELELRFSKRAAALNFVDPKGQRPAQIGDPNAMREAYLKALREHRTMLANLASSASMRWCPMRSDSPWANALHSHLQVPVEGR